MNWDELQERAVSEVLKAERFYQAILLTLPTGGGKTRIGMMLIEKILQSGRTVEWMTHRKLLWDQTAQRMSQNWRVGHTRSGMDFTPGLEVTITMIPTERNAVFQHERRGISKADVIIVDEAHLLTSGLNLKLLQAHLEAGHTVIGLTATPVRCNPPYETLIIGASNSELRTVGAHCPVQTFGPSEIDTRQMKKVANGYKIAELNEAVKTPVLFGEVIKHHKILNPDLRPAMLFAPSVDASKWFCVEYNKIGIKAAHIDGASVIVDGQKYKTEQSLREEVLERYETGDIKVLCNRFVLREGLDIPVTYHGIAATVFGSEQAFLQAGGRIMRSHPTKDHAIFQDHGGAWWRYGSLNDDRDWDLDETRKEQTARNNENHKKHTTCMRCGKAQPYREGTCVHCGFQIISRGRTVVEQVTGELKRLDFQDKPKVSAMQRKWDSLLWSYRNAKSHRPGTWRQLMSHFSRETDFELERVGTSLRNKETGETLLRCPAIGTKLWDRAVKYTEWKDLYEKS